MLGQISVQLTDNRKKSTDAYVAQYRRDIPALVPQAKLVPAVNAHHRADRVSVDFAQTSQTLARARRNALLAAARAAAARTVRRSRALRGKGWVHLLFSSSR